MTPTTFTSMSLYLQAGITGQVSRMQHVEQFRASEPEVRHVLFAADVLCKQTARKHTLTLQRTVINAMENRESHIVLAEEASEVRVIL